MSERVNAGIVTAYGAAVRGGYEGTYTQFCADLASLADIITDLTGLSATATTLAEGASATASYANGVITIGIPRGATGNGISSVSLVSTSGLAKTYCITFTDGDTYDFTVNDGKGISSTTLNNDYTLTITYNDGTTWTSTSIRGAKGDTGATPDMSIGTVTTGAAGSSASATITGTAEAPVLNLTIPKGDPGEVPAAAIASTQASTTASKKILEGEYFWLSGILYIATAEIASGGTIVTSGSGANCKTAKVADDVGELKSALDEVTELTTTLEYTPTPAETTWTFGVMGTNGVPAENSSYKYTNKIAVSKGQKVSVDNGRGESVATAARVTVYSGETAKSAQGGNNLPLPFTIPDGIDGVIITVNKGYIYDNAFVNVINATRVNILDDTIDDLEDAISDLQTAQEQMSDDIDELDSAAFTNVYPKRIFITTWTSGICSTDGSIAANDSYRYSNHIPVNKGDEIYVDNGDVYGTPVASAARVTAYKNNSAVSAKGGTNVDLPYIVPEDVDEVVITVNKGYIYQDTSFIYAKIPQTVPMGEYNLNNDNKNLTLYLDGVESGIVSGFAVELVHSYDVPHNKKAMYMAVDVDQYGVLSTDALRLKSLIPYFYFNGEKIGTVVLYDTNGDPFVYGKDGTKIVLGGGN